MCSFYSDFIGSSGLLFLLIPSCISLYEIDDIFQNKMNCGAHTLFSPSHNHRKPSETRLHNWQCSNSDTMFNIWIKCQFRVKSSLIETLYV